MFRDELVVATKGRGTYDITSLIAASVARGGRDQGLCHIFCQHTSASLMLCENADPNALKDVETFLTDLVPDGDARFVHDAEGPDDMPAHIRSILTQSALTVPVVDARLALGTWQGIFLYEHRTAPHRRHLIVSLIA